MSPKYTSPPSREVFNTMVWEIVRKIPAGKVATYGQIATWISPPGGMDPKSYLAFGARWVGGAMANCPEDVPWQRVVNAQGKISLRRGGGYLHQQELLEAEGVIFDDRGRIDLGTYGWGGPDQAWLLSHTGGV